MKGQRRVVPWCGHKKVPALLAGWLVCAEGCGYVGVCRQCVPSAPVDAPQCLCDVHLRLLRVGPYALRQQGGEDGGAIDWRDKYRP